MVGPEFDGLYTSNEYPTFDCDPREIRPEFLVAYTFSQQVWKDFAKGSKGLGNRRQRLQPARLLAHELWLPPLSSQDRIVEVYKYMQELQGDRDRAAVALDALLPAVVDKAFRGDLSGRAGSF
jgi:type I restriction enzyme, S subunit